MCQPETSSWWESGNALGRPICRHLAPGTAGCQPAVRQSVGPVRRNMPRMVNSGRSTDRADPAPQAVVGPTASSRYNDAEEVEFLCRAPNCDRIFPTLRGRGVYENHAHPDWYDRIKLQQGGRPKRDGRKKRNEC